MARIHGVAGEWARVKGTVAGMWPLFLGMFVAGFGAAAWLFMPQPFVGMVVVAVALGEICLSLVYGMRRIERFFVGARGEERVSGILKGLPDKYHVFNDFVAGRLHVDHVVVGPAGVYAVETKNWRGRVTIEEGYVLVNGRVPNRNPLSQALKEASRVKSALAKIGWRGDVTPVLVFASDTFVSHIAEVRGVVVINSCDVKTSFGTDRVVLPPADLERLVSLMENCR
ncbi:MAG: NERD domain-containing protein [Kiritimatiellae bacterium]|nr:NERD domain-containing protein [Kiritimatiellia bacterium]